MSRRILFPAVSAVQQQPAKLEPRPPWFDAEPFRRVSEDVWSAFRPFVKQTTLKSWRTIPGPIAWNHWPQDEARREDMALRRPYFPQNKLKPGQFKETRWAIEAEGFRRVSDDVWGAFRPYWKPPPRFFVGQPPPHAWDYWPQDEAKREDIALRRPYFPQTPLRPWRWQDTTQRIESEGFRRVSDDGWSQFRYFWTPPTVATPYFVYQPAQFRWEYWPQDEARREDITQWRKFMPQTLLSPVRWQDTTQRIEAEGFRRVSDDGWAAFRYFWQTPAVTPIFPYQTVFRGWDYWPQDEAIRERTEYWRFFMPQKGLTPQVATQAENRQQQGAEEYRRVSEDVWSAFRPFWIQPPTPPIPPQPPGFSVPSWGGGSGGLAGHKRIREVDEFFECIDEWLAKGVGLSEAIRRAKHGCPVTVPAKAIVKHLKKRGVLHTAPAPLPQTKPHATVRVDEWDETEEEELIIQFILSHADL